MLIVKLTENKEIPVTKGHPWIFSRSVAEVKGDLDERGVCRVLDSKGHFVCQGSYSPQSMIIVRVLSLNNEPIDKNFFSSRIKNAAAMRRSITPDDTTCFRLINAEGDHLPGLIADVYDHVIVLQFLCPGMESFKNLITEVLHEIYPDAIIHERSDVKSRKEEGLKPHSGPLWGTLPEGPIETIEMGTRFLIDVKTGDKTGFYLDHKANRQKLRTMAKNKDVLDLFCYTGGFSLASLTGGAKSVIAVDISAPSLDLFRRNMDLNHIKPFAWNCIKEDAITFLKENKDTYDIVVCDPPPFEKEYETHLMIHILAMARIRKGGMLFSTISYSPKFKEEDLIKVINMASNKLSRSARIIAPLSQASDHPYLASHPEGRHMHGFIVYVE